MLNLLMGSTKHGAVTIAIRCPNPECRQLGSFEPIGGQTDLGLQSESAQDETVVGHRMCPNRSCRTHVVVMFGLRNQNVIRCYPAERFDFDPTGIPDRVLSTLNEAIECHAQGCFRSAGMMVRRTLEELCRHESADGANLFNRIEALKLKVILPPALMNGLQDLRLLGNDAAHVDAKDYDEIGKQELDVALRFTKEVLKSLYQQQSLLAELQALKSAPGDGR